MGWTSIEGPKMGFGVPGIASGKGPDVQRSFGSAEWKVPMQIRGCLQCLGLSWRAACGQEVLLEGAKHGDDGTASAKIENPLPGIADELRGAVQQFLQDRFDAATILVRAFRFSAVDMEIRVLPNLFRSDEWWCWSGHDGVLAGAYHTVLPATTCLIESLAYR